MQALLGTVILGIAIGYARGGSIAGLSHARLRGLWLIYLALILQLAANLPPEDQRTVAFVLLAASFAAVLTFALANITRMGMPFVAAGAMLNFIVIAANRGMPVSAEALTAIGDDPGSITFRGKHFVDYGSAHLRFLSDIIAWKIRPRIVSIGDLILWGGIALLIQDLMRSARPAPAGEAEP
jgi:hypothetical protein